jgi:hypothetical protein
MSSNNRSFKITDERLEWERTDPWKALEAPEESGDSDSDGDGDETVVESPERREMLIAGVGALAGGLVVALLAIAATVFSSPGPASSPPAHLTPAPRKPSAVVLGPAAHRSHPKVAKKKIHPKVANHKSHPKIAAKTHKAQTPRKHTQPAAIARIHSRPRKHDQNLTHRNRRRSK